MHISYAYSNDCFIGVFCRSDLELITDCIPDTPIHYAVKFFQYSTQVRVPRGSVVKCLTRNPGVLGSSRTRSSGFFRGHFRAQPSTGETQESMNNVSCRRDMTEILLETA